MRPFDEDALSAASGFSLAEREAVSFRLAEVQEKQLGNPAAAVERYAEIVASNPAHREAVAALEGLLAEPDYRQRVATVLARGSGIAICRTCSIPT